MELDGLPSTATPPPAVTLTFDLLPKNPISVFQVYMWPDFGEISSNTYGNFAFTRFSGSSPAV